MLPVEHVADHILALSPYGLSNRELQKILYFAQGFHLASKGEPLFADTLYAWTYGPVSLTIWHKFKGYGYNTIVKPSLAALPPIDAAMAAFLTAIVVAFGSVPQGKLIEYSHADKPWASSFIPSQNVPLGTGLITEYFASFHNIDEYLAYAEAKLNFQSLVSQRIEYLGKLPNIGNDWISGKSESPSILVCNAAQKFLSGLRRYIFATTAKADMPNLVLGPIPSGGVGLEFKKTDVALYVQLHNNGMVELDVERDGKFDSDEISFPEFDEDFALYFKVLYA